MSIKFCSLASGSKGNCHFISDGEDYLLIDVGLNGKQIERKLFELEVDPQKLTGIIISHEHRDHVSGAGVLSRKYNIPIFANRGTWEGMIPIIAKIEKNNIKIFKTDKTFRIGKFLIHPYSISHDANEPVGFTVENRGIKISITTDLGCINQVILERVQGSNLAVIESNHDIDMLKVGKYPYFLKRRILSDVGHLSNEAAGDAILQLIKHNVTSFLLAHLSRENNFPELALATVKNILAENNLNIGEDVIIDVVDGEKGSSLYTFTTGL